MAPTWNSFSICRALLTVTVSLSLAVGNIKGWGAGNLQTFRTYHKAPGGDHDDLLEQEELAASPHLRDSGMVDMDAVDVMAKAHIGGLRDHSKALWLVWVFDAFLRRNAAL